MQSFKCHSIRLQSLKYVWATKTLISERKFCDKTKKPKNLYQTLGLHSSATQSEIKKAYYDLTFKYHPDRNKGSVDASTKFREVTEAYEVLGSYGLRKLYDKGLPLPLEKSSQPKKPIVEPKVQYQSFFDSRSSPPKFQSKYVPIGEAKEEPIEVDTRYAKANKEYESSQSVQKLVCFSFLVLFGLLMYNGKILK